MALFFYQVNCPNCKSEISKGVTQSITSEHLFFGSPIEICPRCSSPYLSGKEYWGILPAWKKLFYLSWGYFLAISQTILIAGILGWLAWELFVNEMKNDAYFSVSIVVLILLALLYLFFRFRAIENAKKWKPDQRLIDLYQQYINSKKTPSK